MWEFLTLNIVHQHKLAGDTVCFRRQCDVTYVSGSLPELRQRVERDFVIHCVEFVGKGVGQDHLATCAQSIGKGCILSLLTRINEQHIVANRARTVGAQPLDQLSVHGALPGPHIHLGKSDVVNL